MSQSGNTVWYSVGRTINTGNYESVRVECGGSMEVTEEDEREEVWEELVEDVEDQFNAKVGEVMEQLGVKKKKGRK